MVFTASSCSLTQLCVCCSGNLESVPPECEATDTASLEPVSRGLNLPLFCLSVCPSCPTSTEGEILPNHVQRLLLSSLHPSDLNHAMRHPVQFESSFCIRLSVLPPPASYSPIPIPMSLCRSLASQHRARGTNEPRPSELGFSRDIGEARMGGRERVQPLQSSEQSEILSMYMAIVGPISCNTSLPPSFKIFNCVRSASAKELIF